MRHTLSRDLVAGFALAATLAIFRIPLALSEDGLKTHLKVNIDLSAIATIESGGKAWARNPESKAVGMYQITPIVLKEWNQFKKIKLMEFDLYDAKKCEMVADWYLHERIPQMLKHFGKEVSVNNLLVAYSAGIYYLVSGEEIPQETKRYIEKYKKLTDDNYNSAVRRNDVRA